jgi:hypothetical protein
MAKFPFARPKNELSAPAEIGAAPASAATPPASAPPDETGEGEGGISLQDMGFKDGSENCYVCEYYDSQSNECMKATGGDKSVGDHPEAAWCNGFEAAGDGGNEGYDDATDSYPGQPNGPSGMSNGGR